jgi:hypothetical protein
VDIYTEDRRLVETRELNTGDIMIAVTGGHGFRATERISRRSKMAGPGTADAGTGSPSPTAPSPCRWRCRCLISSRATK